MIDRATLAAGQLLLDQLRRERDEAIARADRIEAEAIERQTTIARRMYRRGYLTGRASVRRGAPAVSCPERYARGDVRQILTQGTAA